MAYTHYWSRPLIIPKNIFDAIRKDLEKLMLPLNDLGIVLAGWMGKGLPEIENETIRFNGVRECGHDSTEDLAILYPSEDAEGVGSNSSALEDESEGSRIRVKHRCCSGSCACETFVLERSKKLRPHDSPGKNGLYTESVNTGFRPYDIAVTACLLVAQKHLKQEFRVYSDGCDAQWADARRLCQRVLGYGEWFGIVEEYVEEFYNGLDGTVGRRKSKLLTLIEIDPAGLFGGVGESMPSALGR